MFDASQQPSQTPRLPATRASPHDATPAKPGAPVCPNCRSSLNRVPRRFIDRLLSLFRPVHRYQCRSFICSWEGNLACPPSQADRWEMPDANSELRMPALLRRNPVDVPAAGAALEPRESVRLPAETRPGARHAGAGSAVDSSLALPANKRGKASSR